jgi:hypothetical protein
LRKERKGGGLPLLATKGLRALSFERDERREGGWITINKRTLSFKL